jgi:predicted RNA methylase
MAKALLRKSTQVDFDSLLLPEEKEIKSTGVEAIWKIGELLLRAKAKVIHETGDKRAPGFEDWCEKRIGMTPRTARRYMRAFQNQEEDLGIIWSNKSRTLTSANSDIILDESSKKRLLLQEADLTDEQAVIKMIGKGRVDVVIADPPYGIKYNDLVASLARVSKAVLKSTGSLFVMCGQSNLPDMFAILGQELIYRWTFAYLTPGGQSAQIWPVQINTFWKPVLWYSKNGEKPDKWNGDVIKSKENDNDNRFHEWGQSLSGSLELVEKASQPEELIFDPFLGGGSITLAALALGRKVIGIDIDPKCIETTEKRLEAAIAAGQS